VGFGEEHRAPGDDTVDVKDAAGNELLEQIFRLAIAELIEPRPERFRRLASAASAARDRARGS